MTQTLESLKKLRFNRHLLGKVYIAWAKMVHRSYLSWHWRVMQNLKKKTDLWFGKWYEEFGKFLPEHSKVSKLERWWDPFIRSKKCMSLKFTKESCVMTVKNDAKNMERNWLAVSKLTWGIWRIFDPSNRKSQKLAL